jgi:hypothetical protein
MMLLKFLLQFVSATNCFPMAMYQSLGPQPVALLGGGRIYIRWNLVELIMHLKDILGPWLFPVSLFAS